MLSRFWKWLWSPGDVSRETKVEPAETIDLLDEGLVAPPLPIEFDWYWEWRSDELEPGQREYFEYLCARLRSGVLPDVNGEEAYLMGYAYGLLKTTPLDRYGALEQHLKALRERYAESCPAFTARARRWYLDCLLAQGKARDYLEATKAVDIFNPDAEEAFRRLEVQYHWKLGVDIDDILAFTPGTLTGFSQRHPGRFKELFREELEQEQKDSMDWLEMLFGPREKAVGRPAESFCDVTPQMPSVVIVGQYRPPKPRPTAWLQYPMRDHRAFREIVRKHVRSAENRLRDEAGVPRVGEGWVSETALYHAIRKAFPRLRVIHHGRPKWLGRQHFDVWIPGWKIAVEYHGAQHFEPVEFFGGEGVFEATVERDAKKLRKAKNNGVTLIVATSSDSHEEVIARIRNVRKRGS